MHAMKRGETGITNIKVWAVPGCLRDHPDSGGQFSVILSPRLFPRIAVPLFPKPFRQRQSGKVRGGEASVGLDAEALEHGGQLACMLRRMPGRALVEHVYRLHAEEGFHLLPARLVGKPGPPLLQPPTDRIPRKPAPPPPPLNAPRR